ncbi:putative sodium-dependent transporter [Vibrio ponticus]|nr:putative sodium-dependent transporter [Vibrio ponticus]
MITYGSYLRKKENLVQTTAMVTAMDTGVALLAGIAMFPAMFAFSMDQQRSWLGVRSCSTTVC